ncbi:hypothetical protein D9V41_14725 [Aeromicrobium phragmitis]|uniref:Uncharacterized protein n=1 Tax=Aeromicrobium phragmitis TaxID=2478914 RepID=A0A3L8PI00_9ACTN|nr:hypothetical protein [Aeromicrobium phragmitis]RLV54841.1 hypothetical protein D9V41_14725 [Aeromicrobium phragmitis]
MYRWLFGHLRTGKITRTISMVGGQWTVVYDDTDTLTAKFPLAALDAPRDVAEWRYVDADTAPARQFAVCEWVAPSGRLEQIAGGPIWTRGHSDDTDEFTIGAGGLESIFDHRLVLPVLVAGMRPELQVVAWQSAELGLIAKRLVETATAMTGGELPIVLPSDAELGGPGAAHERNYPGYELGKVGERLRQLSEVEDGPEIQFAPRRRADDPTYIEWVMRIGTKATSMMLTQTGRPWILDQRVPRSPVVAIGTDEAAGGLTTQAFAGGQGEGEGKPIEYVTSDFLTNLGYPVLQSVVGGTDTVSQRSTLRAHAGGFLAQHDRPIRTHTAKVAADAFWKLAPGYRPGDWFQVRPREGHRFVGGEQLMRSLQATGGGDTVSVQMAPVKAAI